MSLELSEAELRDLATCEDCSGTRAVPNVLGDYELCTTCTVLPRDPLGPPEAVL